MNKDDAVLQRLIQKRDKLRQKIADVQHDESAETAQGETDNAHEWENADVRDDFAREAEDQLKAVEAALARYESGDYGICTSCGKSIGAKRLEVMPESVLCIACADRA